MVAALLVVGVVGHLHRPDAPKGQRLLALFSQTRCHFYGTSHSCHSSSIPQDMQQLCNIVLHAVASTHHASMGRELFSQSCDDERGNSGCLYLCLQAQTNLQVVHWLQPYPIFTVGSHLELHQLLQRCRHPA